MTGSIKGTGGDAAWAGGHKRLWLDLRRHW